MSCLFWSIGTIRLSAADDSEANKHQTCLPYSLCRVASWQRSYADEWEEAMCETDRWLGGLVTGWVGVMTPSSQEKHAWQSSWQAEPECLSATAWSSERRASWTDWEAARSNLGAAVGDLARESEEEEKCPQITHVCVLFFLLWWRPRGNSLKYVFLLNKVVRFRHVSSRFSLVTLYLKRK